MELVPRKPEVSPGLFAAHLDVLLPFFPEVYYSRERGLLLLDLVCI